MPPVKNLLDIVSCKNFGGSVLLHGSCVRTESLSPPILSSTYAPRIKTRRNLFFDKVKPCAALWINAISKAKPPFLTGSAPVFGNGLETVLETVCSETSRCSPVISVGYGRSRWQIRPFTPSTGVQIPLGTPNLGTKKNAKVQKTLAFFIFSFQYGFPKSSLVRLHP